MNTWISRFLNTCMLLVVAAACTAGIETPGTSVPMGLVFGDIVARCALASIEYELVPATEWYTHDPPSDEPVRVARLTMVDVHTLRGPNLGEETVFYVRATNVRWVDALFERLSPGADLIVCGRFKANMRGGVYALGDGDIFLRDGNSWIEYRDRNWDSQWEDQVIQRDVQETTVTRMAAAAKSIVRASVVATRAVTETRDGREYDMRRVTFKKEDLQKGKDPGETFDVIGNASALGSWTNMLPDMKAGEVYVLFLVDSDGANRPIAGVRSVFKVEGERLLQWNAPTGYTVTTLESEVRRTME